MPACRSAFAFIVVAAAAAPSAASAAPSYDSCTGIVQSLPAVISTPGLWCFDGPLTTTLASGYAIDITANNVTLDCNGFRISNIAAGASTSATGIYAHDRRNITVRDCDVRGFWTGTKVSATSGRVTGSRFEGNWQYGIRMVGDHGLIDGNRVYDTGGSALSPSAIGIHAVGIIDVQDNTVSGVAAGGNASARGIVVQDNVAGSIRGNRIRELSGNVAGIVVSTGSVDTAVIDNGLAGPGANGVLCWAPATGTVRDNIALGFTAAYPGCSDAGNNHPDATP